MLNSDTQTSSQYGSRNKLWVRTTLSPCSPDLAPSEFYFFPKLKEFLRGRKFTDDEDVIRTANGLLRSAGPSAAYQLQETVENDKIWYAYSCFTGPGYELFERPSCIVCFRSQFQCVTERLL